MVHFYNTNSGNAIGLCKKNPQPFEPGASLRLKVGEGGYSEKACENIRSTFWR